MIVHSKVLVRLSGLSAAFVFSIAAQQPGLRDQRGGLLLSGTLSGVVTTTDAGSRPLWRAAVTLRSTESNTNRTVGTNDAGQFEFAGMPAGRYILSAGKPGFVSSVYGAPLPGTPGLTLVVGAGDRLTGLALRLERGGAISGRVTESAMSGLAGITVAALTKRRTNGTARWVALLKAVTDDLGRYRLFGLPEGEYIVAATLTEPFRAATDSLPVGRLGPQRPLQASTSAEQNRSGFYPGTDDPDQAARVRISLGEERTGIDFAYPQSEAPRMEGFVEDSLGQPLAQGQVLLVADTENVTLAVGEPISRSLSASAGRFAIRGLAPGEFTILVLGVQTGTGKHLWAAERVSLRSRDRSVVRLRMQEGAGLAGRVREGEAGRVVDFSRVFLRLDRHAEAGSWSFAVPPIKVAADGTFAATGIPPGRYALSVTSPPSQGSQPGWSIQSARRGDIDVVKAGVDLQQSVDARDLDVAVTDRGAEIFGTLRNSNGRPASHILVMVFSAYPIDWTSTSRRIRVPARPASDGSFRMVGLPPGEYYLAAINSFEPNQDWASPSFLRQLMPSAVRLTLMNGEKKQQDLAIR